jgi:SHS2 domain-containing protein
MPYTILDDIVSADVAFAASGKDLAELFISCASALLAVMLEFPERLETHVRKEIRLASGETDILLYNFLQELLFYKDADSLLLLPEKIEFINSGKNIELKCIAAGEHIVRDRHIFHVDVKAITMHRFSVSQRDGQWLATVVLDV